MKPNDKNPSSRKSIDLPQEFSADPKGGGQRIHSTGSVSKVSFSEVTPVESLYAGSTEEYPFRQELTQIPS